MESSKGVPLGRDGLAATRAGFMAIVGRPNAGKSTLLNRLLGARLSIVTPKAQTTWAPVTGILSGPHAQVVLVDTPGIVERPTQLLHRSLVASVLAAVEGADATLWLVDASRPPDDFDLEVLQMLVRASRGKPVLLTLNKVDQRGGDPNMEWLSLATVHGLESQVVSALSGQGCEALGQVMASLVPEGPFLYPEDDLGTAPVRFYVGEILREVVLEQFRDEIPWSVLPKIESFRESDGKNPTVIEAVLFVERESQKGMVIGKKGEAIRALGSEARRRIETFLGEHVYLDLRVKVLAGWKKKVAVLKTMGLTIPEEERKRSKGGN